MTQCLVGTSIVRNGEMAVRDAFDVSRYSARCCRNATICCRIDGVLAIT